MSKHKLAGVSFFQSTVRNLKEGQELLLIHESWNKFDPNAIAVVTTQNWVVGYIPKKYNQDILQKKRELNYEAKVLMVTGKDKGTLGVNIEIKWRKK